MKLKLTNTQANEFTNRGGSKLASERAIKPKTQTRKETTIEYTPNNKRHTRGKTETKHCKTQKPSTDQRNKQKKQKQKTN